MHHRISTNEDFANLSIRRGIMNQSGQSFADRVRQYLWLAQRKLYAAHNIRAVHALWVERRANREHIARREIQELRYECRGTEIDGNPKSFTRLIGDARFVAQNGGFPLLDLERDPPSRMRLASQSPPGLDLWRSQDSPHIRGNPDFAIHDPQPASAA